MDTVQILLPLWRWEGTCTLLSLPAAVSSHEICGQCRPKVDHLPALECGLASHLFS
jgi:hypothetical protein